MQYWAVGLSWIWFWVWRRSWVLMVWARPNQRPKPHAARCCRTCMYRRKLFYLRSSLGFLVLAFLRSGQDGRGGFQPPARWRVVVCRRPSEGPLPPLGPRPLPELAAALCRQMPPRREQLVVQRHQSLVLVALAAVPRRSVGADGAAYSLQGRWQRGRGQRGCNPESGRVGVPNLPRDRGPMPQVRWR